MEVIKSIQEYEKELKAEKKKFDKLSKRLKKCRSSFEYDNLYDEIETLHEDIQQLQLLITELRRKKRKEEELLELQET